MFGGSKHFVYLCIRNERKLSRDTKYGKKKVKNKSMELKKEDYKRIMQVLAQEVELEDKSLEWLKKTRAEQSRIVADCERSAREIREYVIIGYNGRNIASELVKEKQGELVEAIEMEAEMVQVLVKRIDDEIAKRLETLND